MNQSQQIIEALAPETQKFARKQYKEILILVNKTTGRTRLEHATELMKTGRLLNRDRGKIADDLVIAGLESEDVFEIMRKVFR